MNDAINGPNVVRAFKECGVTHIVWLPDSELGTWESAILAEPSIQLVRVTREGEALAVAGGLTIGGKQPIVVIQCTGFFEAGDALRNMVHDLKLPIFVIVGLRSYYAAQRNATFDSCPRFAEPIMQAWQIPYRLLDQQSTVADLRTCYQESRRQLQAAAVFIAE
jgi:sulfopyruvate decarboxylase TPP-binding subunit